MNNATNPPIGSIESSRQALVQDLKNVVADGGAMLSNAAQASVDEMALARSRLEASLNQTKTRLLDASQAVGVQVCHAADATGAYVRDNPWKMLGLAAAAGLLLGAALKRPS